MTFPVFHHRCVYFGGHSGSDRACGGERRLKSHYDYGNALGDSIKTGPEQIVRTGPGLTFVFPLLIRGGKPTPLFPFVLAFIFCCLNGYLQSGYLLKYTDFSSASTARIVTGLTTFFVGMLINVHSDHVLRNLRKPGETTYKIPHGGMFKYVSGANFFGEIVEWTGFAILNWSVPTVAFALFTMTNIGPRAVHHHRWYKEKFDDYPKNRKALIPFIL
ncbi:3-oxo-5-alpha-steroid 4-dehydrogenase 1 [Elysia marginata]|uniref:3-oxo-5alpha-steroid 4-dehydrogenase (NADP(+)) n=1 Tax=Elysia marginata TaxID=1093978 RepID=A0AAV4EKL2_9GAST|nr:3-oxo-5-alpha-steroid 4-dehydrogenase 1 [Elysia marginata]